jgi:putative copper export protein
VCKRRAYLVNWLVFVVQWLHVLGGIFWFGGTLYVNFVAIPALRRAPPEYAREVSRNLNRQGERVILPVAVITIALGFLRGTVFGRIQSLDALFGTAYGWTWLFGLTAAIATLAWGFFVLAPTANRLADNDVAWTTTPDGKPTPEAQVAIGSVVRVALLELLGFAAVFTAMILMRFGL